MGKVVKAFTGDKRAGEGAMQQSNALMDRAVRELEKIGIPSIEAQEIVLQNPDLILSSAEEKMGRSAYEDINLDPRLQAMQKQALQEMAQRGETGFTPEDIARFESMREQTAGDEQARQKSILSSMAQRGNADSGAQLAQQLSFSQGAAQRAAQASRDIAGQASQARQNSLGQMASTAQSMESQGLQLQGQKASASERIEQFNKGVAKDDTQARRDYTQNLAQTANQQQMYNKGLIQQNFQNQMSKATGMGSALGNQAGMFANQAGMQANASQQQAAGNRALLQMGAQTAMMSDKNVKKEITNAPENYVKNQVEEMYKQLDPKTYSYKDEKFGQGERSGILAQDLEKSKLGNSMVKETSEGKAVDIPKATGSLLAAVAQLQKKVDSLEGKKFADGGNKYSGGGYEPHNTPEYDPKYAQKLGQPSFGEKAISAVGNPINNMMAKMGSYFGDEKSKAYLAQNPEMRSPEAEKPAMSSPADLQKSEDKNTQAPAGGDSAKAKAMLGAMSNSIDTKAPEAWKPSFNPQAIQYQPQADPNAAIRQKIMGGMQAADGGRKMAYEDGGEGTLIPGDDYSGDKLDDNINSGEMVSNLKQQNRLNQLLLELKELKGGQRVDSMVDSGEAKVNSDQQEELMSVLRGEKDVTELPEKNVVEPTQDEIAVIQEIIKLLSEEE
jgi:hypothetical protein